jgi:thioredoxin-related protein
MAEGSKFVRIINCRKTRFMKKRFLLSVLVLLVLFAEAQVDTSVPYKRFPTVPPFSLLQADSSMLTKDKLKKAPVLIMFFSPTCEHCQHQVKDMMKRIDEFKNIQWILATYQQFDEMVGFIKEYKLNKHSNIKVGRDSKYILPPFYQMQNLPYLALYDKKGDLITTYQGNVAVDTLLKSFQ